MQPSATALNNLAVTMGSAWDVVQEGALEAIRIEEGIPVEAVTMAVSVDGAMLGMRKEKGAPGQGNAPRPAGFREASSGTISLYDAAGECLRTVCYGRMPEAGKVSLKGMWSQKRSTVCVFARTLRLCSSLMARRIIGHRFCIAPLVNHDPDSRAFRHVTC